MDVAGWPSRRDGHRWAGTVAAVLGYRAGIECIAHLPDGVRRRNRHPDRSSTVFAPTGALPRARTSVVWLLGLSTHTFNQVIRRRGPETQRDPELVERRHFPESFLSASQCSGTSPAWASPPLPAPEHHTWPSGSGTGGRDRRRDTHTVLLGRAGPRFDRP